MAVYEFNVSDWMGTSTGHYLLVEEHGRITGNFKTLSLHRSLKAAIGKRDKLRRGAERPELFQVRQEMAYSSYPGPIVEGA